MVLENLNKGGGVSVNTPEQDEAFVDYMNYLFDIMEWFELPKKGKLFTNSLVINQYHDYKMDMFFNDGKFTGGK